MHVVPGTAARLSSSRLTVALFLAASLLAGCHSHDNAALDNAKKQAAATGQPQVITTTDSNGNTVTTTVQPPVPGQSGQVVTTTVTPKGQTPPAAPAESTPALSANPPQSPAESLNPAPPTAVQPQTTTAPAPPATPPSIHIPAGTSLAIRINERLSSRESQAGDRFTGQLVDPVADKAGHIAIPKGARVRGVVSSAKSRGRFKGAADLQLRLTSLTLDGRDYPLDTHHLTREEKGKGKRTGALIGGGGGLGMLIGGLAGGGKGALIGGLLGAGAGTAGSALTGNNRDVTYGAEAILNFRLSRSLTL